MNNDTTMTTGKRNIKINGYSRSKIRARQAKVRADAENRLEQYRSLSVDAKIALVHKRMAEKGGQSKKELARLMAAKEVKPAAKKAVKNESK